MKLNYLITIVSWIILSSVHTFYKFNILSFVFWSATLIIIMDKVELEDLEKQLLSLSQSTKQEKKK